MTGTLNMEKLAVFLGLIGAALCWAPQPVQDTPEVAAAKAAHLAALAKAKQDALQKSRPEAQQAWSADDRAVKQESWNNQWADDNALDQWNQVANPPQQEEDGSWKDDESWKNYDDGSWKESDSTEAPKAENKWSNVGEPSVWKGPIALPPGYDESGAPLPVEDTPEVAAAKAKHLQAYVRAATKTSPATKAIPVPKKASPVRHALPKPLVRPALPNPQVRPQSHGPLVRPALPPQLQAQRVVPKQPAPIYELDGVGDTPEVAAAKAAHFAAHANRRL